MEKRMNSGHPKGKTRYDLLPPNALEEVARTLQWAAETGKYKEWSWMIENRPLTYYMSSAFRHIYKWFRGERNDPETNLPHLAHAASRLLMLIELDNSSQQNDSPYRK